MTSAYRCLFKLSFLVNVESQYSHVNFFILSNDKLLDSKSRSNLEEYWSELEEYWSDLEEYWSELEEYWSDLEEYWSELEEYWSDLE